MNIARHKSILEASSGEVAAEQVDESATQQLRRLRGKQALPMERRPRESYSCWFARVSAAEARSKAEVPLKQLEYMALWPMLSRRLGRSNIPSDHVPTQSRKSIRLPRKGIRGIFQMLRKRPLLDTCICRRDTLHGNLSWTSQAYLLVTRFGCRILTSGIACMPSWPCCWRQVRGPAARHCQRTRNASACSSSATSCRRCSECCAQLVSCWRSAP